MTLKTQRIRLLFSLMILSLSLKSQHANILNSTSVSDISQQQVRSGSCNNLDFTDSITGWVARWCDTPNQVNYTTPANALPTVGFNSSGKNLFGFVHELVTPGMDPHVPISRVPPGHTSAIRLGDDKPILGGGPATNPYNHQMIRNTFTVSAANPTITYWYAVVFDQDLQKPHDLTDQPYFKIRLFDQDDNEILCASYDVNATSGSSDGFQTLALDNKVEAVYKDWVPIFIPLINYVNQKMTIQFESSDCSRSGHFGYAYIAVDCDPYQVITSDPYICGSDTLTLKAPLGAHSYKWTGPGIIQPDTNQVVSVDSAGKYQVTMTVIGNNNVICTFYLDTIIPGNANGAKALFSNTTVCVGDSTQFTDESTPVGSILAWSWDFNNDGVEDSNLQNPSYTFPAAGTFPVKLTIRQNPCYAVITKNVTVNPPPDLLITAPPAVCKPQTIDITTPSVTAGSTSAGSLTYWQDSTALLSLINPTALSTAGTYYIKLTSAQGCSVIKPVTITFNTAPVLSVTNPASVCAPATVDITNTLITSSNSGTCTLSYWSDSVATVPLSNPKAVTSGTYYVKCTPITGCISIAPIEVTVNPFPTVNAGSALSVCPGGIVELNGLLGGSAISATWSGGAGVFSNKDSLKTFYTPTPSEYASGSVKLTLTTNDPEGPCTAASSDVIVTFYKNPVIQFGADKKKGCPVLCTNFKDSSLVIGANITAWEWNFGDSTSTDNTSNIANPSHCYENKGFYDVSLKVTSDQGCVSTLTVPKMIEVFAVPLAEFIPNPNPATMEDSRVTLKNASSIDVVYWNYHFGDGDSVSPTVKSPLHIYPSEHGGSYLATLKVMNAKGCVSYVEHLIEISPEFSFYIPNAFTPTRNDGVNDTFFGKGVGIVTYHLWIFDRWGNMIFNTADINEGWDGRANNGKDIAQEDVFVWKVQLTDIFGRKHDYIGTVTLVK